MCGCDWWWWRTNNIAGVMLMQLLLRLLQLADDNGVDDGNDHDKDGPTRITGTKASTRKTIVMAMAIIISVEPFIFMEDGR